MAVVEQPLKPRWASATFLQYLGTIFAIGALLALFTVLQDEQGSWGLFGWSALALLATVAAALGAERRGERVVAGLLATVALVCWIVLAGSLFDAIGFDFAPGDEAFFNKGLSIDTILVEVIFLVGALYALSRFRFPLLVLPIAAVIWYAVMDLLEGLFGGGNTATAILAILVGLVFVLIGASYDGDGHHPYAFWLHVLGGLSVGGGILWFWHEHTWEWLLVMIVSLIYIAVARSLDRSSYAVLGTIGILATTTYFTFDGFSVFGAFLPFGSGAIDEGLDPWQVALSFVAAGLVIVLLGLVEDRVTAYRRR